MDERTIKRRYITHRNNAKSSLIAFNNEEDVGVIRTSHNPDLAFENRVNMI